MKREKPPAAGHANGLTPQQIVKAAALIRKRRAQLKREMPDKFLPGQQSGFLDPDFLQAPLRDELWDLLPPKLQASQAASEFLSECSKVAQHVKKQGLVQSSANQLAELKKLVNCSRRMVGCLNSTGKGTVQSFNTWSDTLALVSDDPKVHLAQRSKDAARDHQAGRLLGAAWDIATDIESVASYAIEQLGSPSKQKKTQQQNARRLIADVAARYNSIYKELPPASKNSWFVPFVERLGDVLELSCGAELVASVFKERFK